MTDREILKYILLKLRSEKAALEKRWGTDMPEIPRGEMVKLNDSIRYIQGKLMLLNQREYGYEYQNGNF